LISLGFKDSVVEYISYGATFTFELHEEKGEKIVKFLFGFWNEGNYENVYLKTPLCDHCTLSKFKNLTLEVTYPKTSQEVCKE